MSEQQATIRSVAVAAGVSMSTVSNVLSGRHEQMAPETRERVLAAIASLDYQPNHAARSLVTKRTATIGLIMSEVTNSLYPRLPSALRRHAGRRGTAFCWPMRKMPTASDVVSI